MLPLVVATTATPVVVVVVALSLTLALEASTSAPTAAAPVLVGATRLLLLAGTVVPAVLVLPVLLTLMRSLLLGRWALIGCSALRIARRGRLSGDVDGTGNGLRVVVDVQALVDRRRDGLDLGTQVTLDVVKVEPVFPADQVDSQTEVAVPTRSSDTVQVSFSVLGEVKVYDNVDSLNVNTSSKQIRAHQVPADSVSEVVEDTVSCLLLHLGMTVEARVAELGDLLGKKFDSVRGIAEDDGLVDLQFGEESVQAVDLLLLLDKGIVLSDTPEGKLVHEVDLVGVGHVLVGKFLNRNREGSGEEHHLSILGVELQELLDDGGEFDGEKLVGFVHDEHWAFAEVGDIFTRKVEDTTRRTDYNVYRVLQTQDVVPQSRTTSCNHNVDA